MLQACWEDSIGGHHLLQGSKTDFLHSPLLDELKALESRVQAEFSVLTPSALVVDRLVSVLTPSALLVDRSVAFHILRDFACLSLVCAIVVNAFWVPCFGSR